MRRTGPAADGAGAVVDLKTDRGVLYTMETDEGAVLTDRLASDGVAAAGLPGAVRWGDVQLLVNYSTSAAGRIRCEIQDETGQPIPGFAVNDCDSIYGDHIERAVTWRGGLTELRPLVGRPVRLRFELQDADLYAIRFGQPE